jgi:flagellar basal-body rod modification protein FlgD
VTLQQSAQATQALALVGATVVVNGSAENLSNGQATWTLNATKPAAATITIADSTGRTAFTGNFTVNSGSQTFTWDGHGNDGTLWPDGTFTLSAVGTDASGQSTAISTQVQAKVNSVDLTQTPPVLSINGQSYTVNQLQQIVATN